MNYPIRKQILVNGVKVEIAKFNENDNVGAKVFCNDDDRSMAVYKYCVKEAMLTDEFLGIK